MSEATKEEILRLIRPLTDKQKAGVAAAILSDTDPTPLVVDIFFDLMTPLVHDEVLRDAKQRGEKG